MSSKEKIIAGLAFVGLNVVAFGGIFPDSNQDIEAFKEIVGFVDLAIGLVALLYAGGLIKID